MRVYVDGESTTHSKDSTDSIEVGVKNDVVFKWNAFTKTYTLQVESINGTTVDLSETYLDVSGTDYKPIRLGTDYNRASA